MKYKIGQKVRVITWKDMPQNVQDAWGILTLGLGEIFTIKKLSTPFMGYRIYQLSNSDHPFLSAMEKELEPLVEVGEQLVFPFMKE